MCAERRTVVGPDPGESVPLFEVRAGDVRRVQQKRGWVWGGRLMVLAALMVQSVGTLVLAIRRMEAKQLGEIDVRNAMMAVGGFVIQLQSAGILLRSEHWEFVSGPAQAPTSRVRPWTRKHLGITATVFVTLSAMLNSWYFRFHVKDTYSQILQKQGGLHYIIPRGITDVDVEASERYAKATHWVAYPRPTSKLLLGGLVASSLSSD
jgi:hypothetical protein